MAAVAGWMEEQLTAGGAPSMVIRRRCNGYCAPPCWTPDAVRDDMRAFVVAAHLGHLGGVLICGETRFLKNGTASVGVQRQHSGTAGQIENSQVGCCCPTSGRPGRCYRPPSRPAQVLGR